MINIDKNIFCEDSKFIMFLTKIGHIFSVNNYFLFLFRKNFELLSKNETINYNRIADLHITNLQSKPYFKFDSRPAVYQGDQR